MISTALKHKIQQAAIKAYPNEMCGFVVGDEFYEVPNEHKNPQESFSVSEKVWAEFERTCSVFIHSHPDWYPCPSERDMRQQTATNIVWGIVSTNGQAASEITLFGKGLLPTPDLKNRPFIHGVTDCCDAITDWYLVHKGIEIKSAPRSWEWWEGDQDLYKDNFKECGFYAVPEEQIQEEGPRNGDVFLASIGKKAKGKFNHGGVYVANGLGYHHLTAHMPVDVTRLAKEEPLNRWVKHINLWLRYKNV